MAGHLDRRRPEAHEHRRARRPVRDPAPELAQEEPSRPAPAAKQRPPSTSTRAARRSLRDTKALIGRIIETSWRRIIPLRPTSAERTGGASPQIAVYLRNEAHDILV